MRHQEVLELLEGYDPEDYVYIYESGCYGHLYVLTYEQDSDNLECETCGSWDWPYDQGYVSDLIRNAERSEERVDSIFEQLRCELECIIESGELRNKQIELFDESDDSELRDQVELEADRILDESDEANNFTAVQTKKGLRIIGRENLDGYYLEEVL